VAGRDEVQLLGAIAGRFDRLIKECEASLRALEQSLPALRDARRRLGEPQESPPLAFRSPPWAKVAQRSWWRWGVKDGRRSGRSRSVASTTRPP
jgi:hypothetical protein